MDIIQIADIISNIIVHFFSNFDRKLKKNSVLLKT